MLRNTLRRFIADRVLPYGDAWEEQGFVPREVLREMGSLGLLGMRLRPSTAARPRHARQRRARRGARALHLWRIFRHRARAHRHGLAAPLSRRYARAAGPLDARHHRGPQDHRRCHDRGRRRLRPCLHAHQRAQGDGGYVLNGAKMFITNGVHGDLYFVAAKTGDAGRSHASRCSGSRRARRASASRARSKKTGWLCSDTAELVFEDCFVPDDQRDRRGGPRLLRAGAELAERAPGARGAGPRRSHEGHRDHAGVGQAAPGLRRGAVGEAGHPPAAVDALAQVEAARALVFNTAWRDTRRARTSSRKCR